MKNMYRVDLYKIGLKSSLSAPPTRDPLPSHPHTFRKKNSNHFNRISRGFIRIYIEKGESDGHARAFVNLPSFLHANPKHFLRQN